MTKTEMQKNKETQNVGAKKPAAFSLPEGWEEVTLGEVCENISRRFDFSKKEKVIFINTGDVLEGKFLHNKYISKNGLPGQAKKAIEKGDILYSEIRPKNKRFALVDFNADDYVVSTKFMVLKRNEKIDLNFLYLFLTSKEILKEFNQTAEARSGTFPQITFDAVKHIKINLPPLSQQKAIAKMLSAFDDKIELLREQNETLEKIGETIFKEYFSLKNPHPNPLPEGEGGLLDGWRVGKLSGIADFLNGLALQKYPPRQGEENLPVIKIKELKQGITENTDRANTDLDEKYIVKNGNVLFSWSGSLEVVIWTHGKGALNQHLFKVTSDSYPKWFYYYWLLHHLKEFKNVAATKATTMGHINRKHLDIAEVLIPDKETMDKIGGLLIPVLEKFENNSEQIQTLAKTRDTLLPKLMKGEIILSEK